MRIILLAPLIGSISAMGPAQSNQVSPPPPERVYPWQLPMFLRLETEPKLIKFYKSAMLQHNTAVEVEVDLGVNPAGKVTACEVKTQAIDPKLATVSCQAARTARFQKSGYGAPAMPLKLVWNHSNSQVVAAKPGGHPARLARPPFNAGFSYPAEARRLNEQGRAVADITVSAEGRPTACIIRRSTGSASLDAATCQVMMTLGRYETGVDVFGAPIPGIAKGILNWQLPEETTPTTRTKTSQP